MPFKFITAKNWPEVVRALCDNNTGELKVRIDFSELYQIDLAEAIGVSLIADWFRTVGTSVGFIHQNMLSDVGDLNTQRATCRKFLLDWGIEAELDRCANQLVAKQALGEREYMSDAARSIPTKFGADAARLPLRPITNQYSVRQLVAALQPEVGAELLGACYPKRAAIARGGRLASVIVRELASNIAEHAFFGIYPDPKWHKGFVSFDSEMEFKKRTMKNRAYWQQNYIERMGGNGILRVAIGDNGVGIQHTIHEAYKREHREYAGLLNVLDYSRSVDILKWAFQSLSSRKERPSRAQSGLSLVLEEMHRQKGLMSVCSGGVRVVWDFSGDDPFEPVWAEHIGGPFRGTLFELMFPFAGQGDSQLSLLSLLDDAPPAIASPEQLARELSAEIVSAEPYDDAAVFDAANRERVDAALNRAVRASSPLVVDLWNPRGEWDKHSFSHLVNLLAPIASRACCLVAGLDEELQGCVASGAVDVTPLADSLVCAFDLRKGTKERAFGVCWLGQRIETSRAMSERMFKSTAKSIRFEDGSEEQALAKGNPRWFHKTGDGGFAHWLDMRQLKNIALATVEKRIAQVALDSRLTGSFRLSDRYYLDEYIPLREIVKRRGMPGCIARGMTLLLDGLTSNTVLVGTSFTLKHVIEDGLGQLADSLCVASASDADLADEEVARAIAGRDVYFIVDVIGDGTTARKLKRLAERCGARPCAFLAVVDTRDSCAGEPLEGIRTASLCELPIRKWREAELEAGAPEGLVGDVRTSRVRIIDPATGVISVITDVSTLFENGERFWDELCWFGAVTSSHKQYGEHEGIHHPYYVDSSLPFSLVSDDLEWRDRASRNIDAVRDKLKLGTDAVGGIATIVYPDHREAALMADSFRSALQGVEFVSVSEASGFVIPGGNDVCLRGRDVLVMDSGTITGSTLRSIASQVALYSPASISYFVALNRLSEAGIFKLVNQVGVGGSFVYGAKTSMPAYRGESCPLCRMKEEYERNRSGRGEGAYRSDAARAMCAPIIEMLAERPARIARENSPDAREAASRAYLGRIEFWGAASSRNVGEMERAAGDALAHADDSALGSCEVARLLFILVIASHADRELRRLLRSNKTLGGLARRSYAYLSEGAGADEADETSREKAMFRLAKFLSYCCPDEYLRLLQGELSEGSSLRNCTEPDYFRLLDSMRDVTWSKSPRVRQLLNAAMDANPGLVFFQRLKADLWSLYADESRLGYLSIRKKSFWSDYNGDMGPSHTAVGRILNAISSPAVLSASLAISWANYREVILAHAATIVDLMPEPGSSEWLAGEGAYDGLTSRISMDSESLLSRCVRDIDAYFGGTGAAEEASKAARRLKALLYPSGASRANDPDFTAYDCVQQAYALVSDVVRRTAVAESERLGADAVRYEALLVTETGGARALLSAHALSEMISNLIDNVIGHDSSASCEITCDTSSSPVSVQVLGLGEGSPGDGIDALVAGEYGSGYLSSLMSAERRQSGYDVVFERDEARGGLAVTLYLEVVREPGSGTLN